MNCKRIFRVLPYQHQTKKSGMVGEAGKSSANRFSFQQISKPDYLFTIKHFCSFMRFSHERYLLSIPFLYLCSLQPDLEHLPRNRSRLHIFNPLDQKRIHFSKPKQVGCLLSAGEQFPPSLQPKCWFFTLICSPYSLLHRQKSVSLPRIYLGLYKIILNFTSSPIFSLKPFDTT